jgi:hypothetical protein
LKVQVSRRRNRDSAVGIATGYGLNDQGVGVRGLVRARIFISSPRLQVPRSRKRGSICLLRRSQWPRGPKHEPSSPARKPGSWVRIPLRYGCLCAFILFVLFCVLVAALRRADPRPRSVTDCVKRSRNLKSGQGPQGLYSHRYIHLLSHTSSWSRA